MEYQTLIDELNKLDEQIKTDLSDERNGRFPIYDGALDLEYYLNCPLKILWLMKEPYDDEGGKGGGWSFSIAIKEDEDFKYRLVKGSARATWQPVVYTSFGILNNFMNFEDMNYIRDNHEMPKIIKNIAWVNIQKLPSKNGTRTNGADISEAYINYKSHIHQQIELLQPNIIICASTMDLIRNDFELQEMKSFESINYCLKNRTLFIDAYHPAQTTIKRDKYVNDIIYLVHEHSSVWK